MKHSEVIRELESLLDRFVGDTNLDAILTGTMSTAMNRLHIKKSKRPHAEKLLREFWTLLLEQRSPPTTNDGNTK